MFKRQHLIPCSTCTGAFYSESRRKGQICPECRAKLRKKIKDEDAVKAGSNQSLSD